MVNGFCAGERKKGAHDYLDSQRGRLFGGAG